MRILHILDHSLPRRSGFALRTHALITHQRAHGWHTFQLTGPWQGALVSPRANPGGCHFYRTCAFAARRPRWRAHALRALALRIADLARITRPDVLHAHAPSLYALAALYAARRCALPLLYDACSWRYGSGLSAFTALAAERLLLRRADAVAVGSRALLADVRARGVQGPVAVVPLATERTHRHGPRMPAKIDGLDPSLGPVLAYMGELAPHQGIDLLLEALPRLADAHPNLRLLLLGSAPADCLLRTQVRAHRLASHVILIDDIHGERMRDYFSLADLMVFPRPASREAELFVPFRALEAMAHGCAVAASNTGGHRELIQHGRTGVLFAAGDADAMCGSLLAMLADPLGLARLRNAARAHAAARHSWEASIAGYAPLYEHMLACTP